MNLFKFGSVGAALASVLLVPTPADANINDGPTSYTASWGAGSVDIDLAYGGQWISYWLDDIDPPSDGYCVYMYVQVLVPDPDAGWKQIAKSCGKPVSGTKNMLTEPGFGSIGPTVKVTRGVNPGNRYFSLYNSMV